MKRTEWIVWLFALAIGIILMISFQEPVQIVSTFVAWCLICGIWQSFSKVSFVARDSRVSKMSTDQASRYLRLTVRRMLAILLSALVLFLCAREFLGLAYWLSIVGYYQVGIALTIRDVWRTISIMDSAANQA